MTYSSRTQNRSLSGIKVKRKKELDWVDLGNTSSLRFRLKTLKWNIVSYWGRVIKFGKRTYQRWQSVDR